MAKYRVTYVAVKHERTYRQGKSGQPELLDDRLAFREEKSVNVEAENEAAALDAVKATIPADCEFTGQAARATSGQML
jgi:hypothetical protein